MSSRVSTNGTDGIQDERLSQAVVSAVAAAEGLDPIDLEVPLYAAVDTDALDTLFRSGIGGRIEFTYYGYQVTVSSDGLVRLAEQ